MEKPITYNFGDDHFEYGIDDNGRCYVYFPDKIKTRYFKTLGFAKKVAHDAYYKWWHKTAIKFWYNKSKKQ